MLRTFAISLIIISTIILLNDCAKIGSVPGGPRDEDPPTLVKTEPENYSTGFNEKRIEIEFDEFLQLNNINKELVVSPPLEKQPVVRLKNKSIIIDLESELKDSTTYTLNFGKAIADNNEGNVIENFEYVFSTGSYIDSLGLSGMIVNAFDNKPSEDPIMIMLYDKDQDSLPYNEIPMYVGKTRGDGSFLINNIKPDTFKVFALKDGNFNFLYDLPDEKIGFLDTTVILSAELIQQLLDSAALATDTIHVDSTSNNLDSLVVEQEDSVYVNPYAVFINLSFFQEDNTPQYLNDYSRDDPRKLEFIFNRPVKDSVQIEPLNFSSEGEWFIREEFTVGDSLVLWITDSLIYKKDTLKLHLTYLATDSILNYYPYHDTLSLVWTETSPGRRKKDTREEEDEMLLLILNIRQGGTFDLYKPIQLVSDHPVQHVDDSKYALFFKEDTIELETEFILNHDTVFLRRYRGTMEWEERMNYRLYLEQGAITDIYGLTHDTMDISFKTQSLEHYGKIILSLSEVNQSLVVQLLDDKGGVVREKSIENDSSIEFPFLEPGTYSVKIIYDRNSNKKWDTGKYLMKQQPERVHFYPDPINVRSNWDMEIFWRLED